MRVPERWVPVFIALLGVLGGIGGAFVGGFIANEGQDQRFKNEREAARHDLRQDAYANYLQEGYGYLFQIQLKRAEVVEVTNEELKARAQALVGAQAAVALFGNVEFQDLANDLTNALGREDEDASIALLIKFTNLAKEDLDLGTGE
jgi:hypothetical protein